VAAGKADYILTLVSEILPAPGVELIGPLPEQVQNYISFSAGVSPKAAQADAGKALVQFFKGPAAAAVYKAKGLEPR
jgi:molybdate transport system substrate-binding protein